VPISRGRRECFCVAVLVVLPQLGNLWSRELRLLGQIFAAFVNLEFGKQG
jgi:hypothetical protein